MQNTALLRVTVGAVSGYKVHHLPSPVAFLTFWTRSSLIVGQEGGGIHSLASSFSRFDFSGVFLLAVYKIMFIVKKLKMWISYMPESSELQSALPTKCLPVPIQKLNIVLMYVVPLMVPLSAEHIRNFVRDGVWEGIGFFSNIYGWRYTRVYPKVSRLSR